MSTVLFYYRVLYSDGDEFYKKPRASVLLVPWDCVIVDFLETVRKENPEDIAKFSLGTLQVYKDLSAFEKRSEKPLEDDTPIIGLGSEDEPVILILPIEEDLPRKRQQFEIKDLTNRLRSFANAQLVEGCIQSEDQEFLPYPQDEIKKIFVRKCYEDVFDLILEHSNLGLEAFAISGTPGIGKSLFFVYILYRLMKDLPTETLPWKASRVVYQSGSKYKCFDLQWQIVMELFESEAKSLVRQKDTFYLIDGPDSMPFSSTCVVLFISYPCSGGYKDFVNKKMAKEWFFPVWKWDELKACQRLCYPNLPDEMLQERHRTCGGAARFVFHWDYSISVPKKMSRALLDVVAVSGIRSTILTKMPLKTHDLLRIVVSDDEQYEFLHVDIASKYVGERLWKYHFDQMRTNLQEMFDCISNKISRHLFAIYGHLVLSVGGNTLNCRCLESGTFTEITLDALLGKRISFGKDTIFTSENLAGNYFELKDDDNTQAIDSLSPQGMFRFTDSARHPIRGLGIVEKLCKLFEEPKLYFVVPPHMFTTFRKQSFQAETGEYDGTEVSKLKQYVLELPISQRILVD